MTEQNKYSTTPRDYNHVGEMPQTIATGKALGKVDPTSQLLARDIRNFAWAEDTQESIARFIEWCAILYSFTEERNNHVDFSVDQMNTMFTDVIKELSEEKDYHSLPEIAGARGGFNTLGRRLEDTDARLAQTNAEKASKVEVNKLFNEANSGVRIINGYVETWDGTKWNDTGIEYNQMSINDQSVTPDKLSFTLLKQIYSPDFWELGYIDLTGGTGADAKRARSNFIPLKKGSLIKSGNSSVQLLIVCYDGTKTRIANGAGWLKEYEVPYDQCEWVRIGLRYSDNRDISNLADLYSSIQIYSNPETKMELQRTPAKWELGTIDISGVEYESSNRLRTNLIKSIDNQFIRLLDESYQYYAVLYDENLNFNSVSGGWGAQPKHYLVTHPYFKVVIRKVDSSDFSENEIKQIHNKIEINNDRLVGEDIALGQLVKEHFAFDFDTESSPLKGKKLLNFGDSIAAASTAGVDGYHEQISNRYGMQLKSYASGGATITVRTGVSDAHDIVTQVNNSVNNNDIADYILINGGTNDANALTSDKFGDVSDGYDAVLDTETFCGAFEYILKSLKTNFTIPNGTKIIYVRSHNMASRDKRQVTLGELAVEICKKWSVPVVDLYSEGGLNTHLPGMIGAYTIANDDRTHPNTLGYELFYTPLIESKMKSI